MVSFQKWTNLLVEDGLGLTSETLLLRVVSSLTLQIHVDTTEGKRLKINPHLSCRKVRWLYLSKVGSLAGLVLGDLVESVLGALLSLAEGLSFLGHVHHFELEDNKENKWELQRSKPG